MSITDEQWHRVKWAILSRLPSDAGSTTAYLPFNVMPNNGLSGEAGSLEDQLTIKPNRLQRMSQEVKALEANASNLPSDTDAIAFREGWDGRTYL